MNLLYTQASPRLLRSHSNAIADVFVSGWKEYNHGAKITTRNLFEMDLPDFNNDSVDGRYLVPRKLEASPEQRSAWVNAMHYVEDFKSFDRYVFASPMWNYNIPYKFKQYIDLMFQPGLTFYLKDGEYKDAVAQKKVCFILARGQEYTQNPEIDFQKPYLEHIFTLMGFAKENMHWVVIEPTAAEDEAVHKMHSQRIQEALDIAKSF